MSEETPKRRSRWPFYLAAVIFLGPLIAAFVIYRWYPELLPSDHTNYGTLIDPPRPLPNWSLVDADGQPVADAWHGHWSLVYVGSSPECEAPCQERMHFGHQLWLALNEKREKLQRIYLAQDKERATALRAALSGENAEMQWLTAGGDTEAYQFRWFFELRNAESLYLVDPLGNWIMTYMPTPGPDGVQQDFKGMQKDLKKLLKL